MSEQREKEYEELQFTDDFMFCKVLENNEGLCKELLEMILGKKIREIKYLTKQKTIEVTSDGKGVRLDVYVEDSENTVFDIEMQATPIRNLPKRTRYYQGMIDLNMISRREDYNKLKKSFIIFICVKNPFKDKRLHLYTFENRCMQDTGMRLGDESTKVVLTPDGSANDVSPELSELLNYLAGKGGNSSFVKRLDEAVDKARKKEEWRLEYMTLLMRDREKFAEGELSVLKKLIAKGTVTVREAAETIDITVEELEQKLQELVVEQGTE